MTQNNPHPLYFPHALNKIMFQGYRWESCKDFGEKQFWNGLTEQVPAIKQAGIDMVWLPPCTDSLSPEGFLPRELLKFDSHYGDEASLKKLIKILHRHKIWCIADIVINHRVGTTDWADFTNPDWGLDAICHTDEFKGGSGYADSGDDFDGGRDIDHSKDYVRQSIKLWLKTLKDMGFHGWRYDLVKGYAGKYVGEYNESSKPMMSVGEYWSGSRQELTHWLNTHGGRSMAFDFATMYNLFDAVTQNHFWKLKDEQGRPSGLVGWLPWLSVTFATNHDLSREEEIKGRPQVRRLSGLKAPMSNAYLLTHPGVPCLYWDHLFGKDQCYDDIKALSSIRKRLGIHAQSQVNICQANNQSYAAIIDDKLAVKIGYDNWHPGTNWHEIHAGHGFKIWQ